MKILYSLIMTLAIGFLSFAQTSPITFEESWTVGGDDWTIKADEGSAVAISADPETGGTRGNTLEVQYNTASQDWQNAQIKITSGQNMVSVGPGKIITIDVYTDHTGDAGIGTYTGMLKLEQGSNPGVTEYSFPVSGTGWQTVTIDTSLDKGGAAVVDTDYALMVLFTNYGTGAHKKEDLRYYDNITFTDGALIGVDPLPATPAPTPSHQEADVLNLFSDAYAGSIVWADNKIRHDWSNGGEVANIDFNSDATDMMVKMKGANYIGQSWSEGAAPKGAVDISGFANMSVDVWTGELAADATLGIALLGTPEVKVEYTLAAGAAGWRTIAIDLADFAAVDLTSIPGVKWEPNPQGSIPLMYIDNFYAWNAPSDVITVSFEVNASNNANYPNATTGEVFAVNYSTDGGNSYTLSAPFSDDDNNGIWTGSMDLPKNTGAVSYKLAVTDPTSGYAIANAETIDELGSGEFSFTAGTINVSQNLFLLNRQESSATWATTTAAAVVDVTVIIRGLHPDQASGQYGVRTVGGTCYDLGDWTTNTAGVFEDTMSLPFYATQTYNLGFHNDGNNFCGDNFVSKDATTNTDFSVTVVEADVTEDLSALDAVDGNGNYLVYTSTLSVKQLLLGNNVVIYPNPTTGLVNIAGANEVDAVRAFNISGQLVKEAVNTNTLDLTNQRSGLYMIEIEHEGVKSSRKLIIR